jgi:hypothetical protein
MVKNHGSISANSAIAMVAAYRIRLAAHYTVGVSFDDAATVPAPRS